MMKHLTFLIKAILAMFLYHMTTSPMDLIDITDIRKQISEAIKFNDAEQVYLLLGKDRNKKQVEATGNKGNTVLHKACKKFKDTAHNSNDPIVSIIKDLLTIGKYNANEKNRNDDTPFHYINEGIFHPEESMVKLFFQEGAKSNERNNNGNTPFHCLLQGKQDPREGPGGYNPAIIKLFLDNKADLNLPNEDGYTPFHYVCQLGDFELITLCLNHNAKLDKPTKEGKNTPFHFICRNIANLPEGDRDEKIFQVNMIERILQKEPDLNIKNRDGNTPYHHIINGTYRSDFIALFLKYGAREDISNNDGITPYDLGVEKAGNYKKEFRAIRAKGRNWLPAQDCDDWQEYQGYFPNFIKKIFRYCELDRPHDNFIQNDPNIITMVTIHDINDQENKAYYDTGNNQFKGIMEFAKNYITTYNQKKTDKMLNEKKKILHLLSFSWQNDIFSSADQLAEYLDENYRNSRLIFLTHGFSSDVANLTSHRLGYLQGINETIREENKKLEEDEQKLHKGRIKLLICFTPPYRQVIPDKDKSSLLNPLGVVYDKLNDRIATKPPTNYDLMLIFHSPNDEATKPDAFDGKMKMVAMGGVGVGGSMLYVAGKNAKNEGFSSRTLVIGGGGTLVLSYVLWSSYNKRQIINSLDYHRYKKVTPQNNLKGDSFTIKGPKVHLETMINGKYIGHRAPELSQHLSIIFKILKTQYFTELARSRSFCININTKHNMQDIVSHLEQGDTRPKFDDSNLKRTIKNDFKFWANRHDNCTIQCWFDRKCKPPKTRNNLYFYWARENKKLRTDIHNKVDSDDLKNLVEKTSIKHKHLFEYLKELQ